MHEHASASSFSKRPCLDADVRIPWAKLYYCNVEPAGKGAIVIFLVIWAAVLIGG